MRCCHSGVSTLVGAFDTTQPAKWLLAVGRMTGRCPVCGTVHYSWVCNNVTVLTLLSAVPCQCSVGSYLGEAIAQQGICPSWFQAKLRPVQQGDRGLHSSRLCRPDMAVVSEKPGTVQCVPRGGSSPRFRGCAAGKRAL
jgi:hypothetical protein